MSIPNYDRTNWENNVTDADENTMNNIEDGVEDNRGYVQQNKGDIDEFKDGTQSVSQAENSEAVGGVTIEPIKSGQVTVPANSFINVGELDPGRHIVAFGISRDTTGGAGGEITYRFKVVEDESNLTIGELEFVNNGSEDVSVVYRVLQTGIL